MKGVQEGTPEAVLLTGAAAETVRMAGGPWAFLGLWDERPVFAVDCSEADDPLPLLPEGIGGFTDLRAVAGLLPAGEASVLAACPRADALAHQAPLLRHLRACSARRARPAMRWCAPTATRSISRAPTRP